MLVLEVDGVRIGLCYAIRMVFVEEDAYQLRRCGASDVSRRDNNYDRIG
jgi:hypothetical protein